MKSIVITVEAAEALSADHNTDEQHWLEKVEDGADGMKVVWLRDDIHDALIGVAIESPGASISEIVLSICAQLQRNRGEGGTLQ